MLQGSTVKKIETEGQRKEVLVLKKQQKREADLIRAFQVKIPTN
jgi:hypothetical protein